MMVFMKKIALLVYDFSLFGGAEHVAANLANEFIQDYEVYLISCFNEKKELAFPLNDKISTFVLSQETKSMVLHSGSLVYKLHRILKLNQIDAVLNITAGVNTLAYMATRGLSTKTIYCEHSNLLNKTYGKKHEFRQWIGATTADAVVALTKEDRDIFKEKYHIGNKAEYIYNWYEGSVGYEYNVNSKKIISVGRLKSIKGYDRMIPVASAVLKKHPDWSWDIYGEGDYRLELESLISKYGLENRVILKGNDPCVQEKYKEYAFCVMTSYYEGFALVLVEAMAQSIPCVSYDCPTGPREIIRNDVNGYLVEDGNEESMICVIDRLMNDSKLRLKLSKSTVNVLGKFDRKTIYGQWRTLIGRLI